MSIVSPSMLVFFNDTAPTEIYTLTLPRRSSDLGLWDIVVPEGKRGLLEHAEEQVANIDRQFQRGLITEDERYEQDRKSTRLNSSHANLSYAVFCLKKKEAPLLRTLTPHPPTFSY